MPLMLGDIPSSLGSVSPPMAFGKRWKILTTVTELEQTVHNILIQHPEPWLFYPPDFYSDVDGSVSVKLIEAPAIDTSGVEIRAINTNRTVPSGTDIQAESGVSFTGGVELQRGRFYMNTPSVRDGMWEMLCLGNVPYVLEITRTDVSLVIDVDITLETFLDTRTVAGRGDKYSIENPFKFDFNTGPAFWYDPEVWYEDEPWLD